MKSLTELRQSQGCTYGISLFFASQNIEKHTYNKCIDVALMVCMIRRWCYKAKRIMLDIAGLMLWDLKSTLIIGLKIKRRHGLAVLDVRLC